MKFFRRLLAALAVLLVASGIFLYCYARSLAPDYEGEHDLSGLRQDTSVYYDDYGIPHIYALNELDAQRVLGYVHAQDRLWQMELLRRIAPGQLSEIFGGSLVKTDKFFAATGIAEYTRESVARLDPDSEPYRLAMAYVDGINQYMREGTTPVEFTLLGIEKRPYTLEDVHNIFGFMAFSFAMAQKTDPLLTDIRDRFGMPYLKDFGLDGSAATVRLRSYRAPVDYAAISTALSRLLDASPTPSFIGSNSWIVGPKKTRNGKVIFENDPHIGFSQPCTWFEAHIQTPEHELYGFYLAGTPYPLLGHNRNYAYGLTMFENDDIDFFRETEDRSGRYSTPDGYRDYRIVPKTIKVKDSTSVRLDVKVSRHGPLVNGILDGVPKETPIAMSWIFTQHPNHLLEATYSLSHAADLKTFTAAVGLIHAPGLNVMYGDAKNNIAWIAAGKLYRQHPGVNPNFILDGATGDDWKQYLDFSKNPGAVNPDWGYVYSANNQHEAADGYLYPGYYLPHDRAGRIESLVKATDDWTADGIRKMTMDDASPTAVTNVRTMLQSVSGAKWSANEQQAIDILGRWDGTHGPGQAAPTVYNKWLYHYLHDTFGDELGPEKFTALLGTHIVKQMIEAQLANPASPWWDDIRTPAKETRQHILTASLRKAIAGLEKQVGGNPSNWKWEEVHLVTHEHPLGKVALFRPFFNVGPFAAPGSNEVINNQLFLLSDEKAHAVKAGPSTRRVIDFSDVDAATAILPTGNSGVFTSPHYDDQAALYNKGGFRPMLLDARKIKALERKMIFRAKKP